jgi:hypothetical protein
MATADLNALFEKVRRLPPEKLRQVEALVQRLEYETPQRPSRFQRVSGILTAEDARAMTKALDDCERIDPRGW